MENLADIVKYSKNLTLLYVEDDEAVREHTLEVLHKFFETIIVAKDGDDGLEKFFDNQIDLVFTDVHMPNLNGLDMAKRILDFDNNIPIIINSALDDIEYFIQAIEIHVDGYLVKPLDISILAKAIKRVIKKINFQEEFKKNLYLLNLYQDLTDSFSAVSKTDLKGVITYVSKALEKISGYSKEELIGKTHRMIKNDEMDPLTYKKMWDTITDKKVFTGEILNKRKDGTSYWIDATIIPNLDSHGDIIGFSAYRRDITNQKDLELEKIKRQEQTIELLAVHEALEKLSTLDPLMQIPNRLSLDTNMKVRYDSYQRYKNIFSLIMIDIDYFKSVNDTYGHLVGDDILKSVSKIIQENIRTTDLFGRWGGEEFMIICEETDIDGAYELAEKIRIAIQEKEFDVVGRKTISLGIAQIQDNISINEFIQGADDALFYAKNNGRNKTMKYTTTH